MVLYFYFCMERIKYILNVYIVLFEINVKWIDWFYKVFKNKNLLILFGEIDIFIVKVLMGLFFN